MNHSIEQRYVSIDDSDSSSALACLSLDTEGNGGQIRARLHDSQLALARDDGEEGWELLSDLGTDLVDVSSTPVP